MCQYFYPFVLQAIFLWGFVRFYRPVTVLKSSKRFLHIITRKKTNQQYKNISLSINQSGNSLNLINVQFLTNALGNYVWAWRGKLRPDGENIEIIQWNTTTKFLSRRFTYQSFFILGHS